MKIGVLSFNYAWKRLIVGKVENARYCNVMFSNLYFYLYLPYWVARVLRVIEWSESHYVKTSLKYRLVPWLPKMDLLHFFNAVSYEKGRKWVASIEAAVPWSSKVREVIESDDPDFSVLRNDRATVAGVERLLSSDCLAMLPFSSCTANIQKELLAQFGASPKALSKIRVLHPPQEVPDTSLISRPALVDGMRVIFVGGSFFRKGGRETVQVLSDLVNLGANIRLILISKIGTDDERYVNYSGEVEYWKTFVSSQSWIEHHEFMPNRQVIETLATCHLSLLPTYMDTYGYSVLESQSVGCPVVTTALRSMPEINGPDVGWLIDVPTNRLGHPLIRTKEQLERQSEAITSGLRKVMDSILADPDQIQKKSERCKDRIREMHDPKRYSLEIENIYRERG